MSVDEAEQQSSQPCEVLDDTDFVNVTIKYGEKSINVKV